jgi:hypothetical protein
MKTTKTGPEIPSGAPDTNPFGGKNPIGLYVPMSDDEQEVLFRLVSEENIVLIIHGWGRLDRPRVQFGDHRVRIDFRLDFKAPEKPMEVRFFDLELKTRIEDFSLFKKRMAVSANGNPIIVQAGMFLEMSWDIAIDHMEPALVKALKPGAFGFTSRRLDKDTGARTLRGNMKVSPQQDWMLRILEQGASKVQTADAKQVFEATKASGAEIKEVNGKLITPDLN